MSTEPPTPPVVVSLALDGVAVAPEQAAFLPLTRGLLYGDGLFESLLVSDGLALGLDRHFTRMAASAAALGFPVPSRAAWDAGIAAALAPLHGTPRANLPRSLRITWTRGAASARGYSPRAEDRRPQLLVALYDQGIDEPDALMPGRKATIVSGMAPGDLARHKTLSAMTYVVAQARARERGGDEALLVDAEGRVLEAAGSNVFARFGADGLWTPPLTLPILPGLTRAWILEQLPDAREATFSIDDLARADEVFLTNAVRGVVRIRSIDGRAIGDAMPGEAVMRAHRELERRFMMDVVRAEKTRDRAVAPDVSA